ncbi:Myosin-IB-like Protein [Tribolium castaneum]|uniref:Myosin-IB-like Protein n=1 Tax=Tribolium castaneum TaxID=7070 RepID=A0A139WLU0_TRICA|nr:Myosin-IB-like Protein [Tribolium castaneum]
METHLQHRDRVGVQDAVLLEDYTSEAAFVENLEKRFKENIIYVSTSNLLCLSLVLSYRKFVSLAETPFN